MSKKRFVQSIVARICPQTEKLPDAIRYAENLWDELNRHGYGDDKTPQPRDGKDYYRALSERQRAWFDKFWDAFGLKKNRNGAAMRWQQLGELDGAAYAHIIDAAGKEAQRQLPQGQARKEAQGWLYERRFDDYAPTQAGKKQQKNSAVMGVKNELRHLRKLYEMSANAALLPQIEQLEQRLSILQSDGNR